MAGKRSPTFCPECDEVIGTTEGCATCQVLKPEPPPAEEEPAPARTAEAPKEPLGVGLHLGIQMVDYINDPCAQPSLSASTIRRVVERSPLAAWHRHPRLGGATREITKASDVGSAAHALVLEGASIIQIVEEAKKADGTLIRPLTNWQTNDAKAKRDAIRAEGRVPLLTHEAPPVYAMAKKAAAALQKEAGPGRPEVTLVWQEANGVWCRARVDWLPDDERRRVVDYKTTKKSAAPDEFIRRTLYQMGYDVTAAFYLRGLRALGKAYPEYTFLVQEQDTPHDYSWIGFEHGCEALDQVNRWIEKAIKLWGECLKSGAWPGYPKHTHYADPATWRAIQIEEGEMAEQMARETFGEDEGIALDDL